jgi:hypothetical protein
VAVLFALTVEVLSALTEEVLSATVEVLTNLMEEVLPATVEVLSATLEVLSALTRGCCLLEPSLVLVFLRVLYRGGPSRLVAALLGYCEPVAASQ